MHRLINSAAVRRRALILLFVTVLIPLGLVASLAEDVWTGEGFAFDKPILEALHARATPTLDTIMIFFTRIGAPVPMLVFFLAVLAVLLLRRQRGDAAFFFTACAGAMALDFVAKILFGRARPDLWTSLVPESDYSFPSGHAMGSMAVVAALVVLTWETRWRWFVVAVGALFVVLVGLSRLYLGVHYPSDVLTGWLASLAWVGGVALIRSSQFLGLLARRRRTAAGRQEAV